MSVLDTQVGTGSVLINGWGDFAFDLAASVDLAAWRASTVTSTAGSIPEQAVRRIRQRERLRHGLGCAMGSGVVSSTGVAGCIEITSTYQSPDLSSRSVARRRSASPRTPSTSARASDTAGAHRGPTSCQLLRPERLPTHESIREWRAGRRDRERVAAGTTALAWRIHGSHGVPKVSSTGRTGRPSPPPRMDAARSARATGCWRRTRRTARRTCCSYIRRPGPGLSGRSAARLDPDEDRPGEVRGSADHGGGSTREGPSARSRSPTPFRRRVGAPDRARQGGQPPLVRSVHGKRCHGAPANRPGSDEKVLCFTLRFRPAPGPAGVRRSRRSSPRAACRSCRRTSPPSTPRR